MPTYRSTYPHNVVLHEVNFCFLFQNPVIQYQYKQQEYHFTEKATDTQVCLEIVSGIFPPSGYLTVAFFTSQETATGEYKLLTFNGVISESVHCLYNEYSIFKKEVHVHTVM